MLAFVPAILWESSVSNALPFGVDSITNSTFESVQPNLDVTQSIIVNSQLFPLWIAVLLLCLSGLFFFVMELRAHAKDKTIVSADKSEFFEHAADCMIKRNKSHKAA